MADDKQELLTERVITPMTKTLVMKVDDYRYARRIPTRAEAIRQLIEAQLKAENITEEA